MTDDPDHELVELLSDEQLTQIASDMAEEIMGAVTEFAAGKTLDARVVACACGLVAGSYLFGIPDMEIRKAFVDHWIENLRLASGVHNQ